MIVKAAGLSSTAIAATSVAAFFGGLWWPLDLLAGFRPHLGVGSMLVGGGLLLARRRGAAVIALGAGVLNLALVVPQFLSPLPAVSPTGSEITVMTFNVLNQNERFDEVIDFIRTQDPDVVFLHESFEPWEQAMSAANLPYRVVINRDEDLIFATMVLVREPAEVTGFGFATGEPRAVEVELMTAEGPVSILGIHPLSPTDARRAELRDSQIEFAAMWAKVQSGRTIVAGDFNATPWSYPFRNLVEATGFKDSLRGHGLGGSFPTYRHPLLRIPIDHLLYGPGLAVTRRQLGPHLGSDHLPLTVDLVLTEL